MSSATMKRRIIKEKDRLSDLSDSIIRHILSFLNTKQAFQTRILSKRWRNITKLLPILRLSSSLLHSKYRPKFGKLVSHVLSRRDHSTTLHTIEFTEIDDFIEPNILKSIVKYAVSHDIQLLRISIACDLQQFPPCLFSSQTLTSLDLCVHRNIMRKIFPNSLNFPALTTLTLRNFYFCPRDDGCAEPFSAFSKLSNLIIQDCQLLNAQILCIESSTLVNLTVDEVAYYDDSYVCKLYTPNLNNLNYIGTLNQKLFRVCCFKHVYIDVRNKCSRLFEKDYPLLLDLLRELGNIKSLTISFSTLQVLSLIPHLLNVKLNSLYNLESLQIKRHQPSTPLYVYGDFSDFHLRQRQPPVHQPVKVAKFLLQNSRLAKVKVI